MSLAFHAAIPPERLPSINEMNALIAKRAYPLKVVAQGGQSPDDPMAETDGFLNFHAVFCGQLQEIHYCHAACTGNVTEETNKFLQDGGGRFTMCRSAHTDGPTATARIPPEYLAAYRILAGILVLDRGGNGFQRRGLLSEQRPIAAPNYHKPIARLRFSIGHRPKRRPYRPRPRCPNPHLAISLGAFRSTSGPSSPGSSSRC